MDVVMNTESTPHSSPHAGTIRKFLEGQRQIVDTADKHESRIRPSAQIALHALDDLVEQYEEMKAAVDVWKTDALNWERHARDDHAKAKQLEEQLEAARTELGRTARLLDSEVARAEGLEEQLEAAREEVLFLCSDEDDIRKGLREQLEAARKDASGFATDAELEAQRADRLQEQLEALRETLDWFAYNPTIQAKHQQVARDALAASNPASGLHALTTADAENEPADVRTDDDFEV